MWIIMPYIRLDKVIHSIDPHNKGELNYKITCAMVKYLEKHGVDYQNISDVIAAANDAAEEMRRRVMNPYENKKIREQDNVDPYNTMSNLIGELYK